MRYFIFLLVIFLAPAYAMAGSCNGKRCTIECSEERFLDEFGYWLCFGTQYKDIICGTNEAEDIYGFEGNDVICGFSGDDYINGDVGHDVIFGGHGQDIIFGQGGADWLDGGWGDDLIIGGGGPPFDQINGNLGTDTCLGGELTINCE